MRKGYHRALEILKKLRDHDHRYRLEVFGTRPEELPWLKRNAIEMAYYKGCEEFIERHNLRHVVHFNGHVDITQAIAKRRVGYVLSLSDSDYGIHGFESFHLAVADGLAAGGVSLVRRWPGAEYLWPQQLFINDEGHAVKRILQFTADPDYLKSCAMGGEALTRTNYSLEKFTQGVIEIYMHIIH
jgi:glycosyltransferase involved in cell wall biosynthesis